MPSISRPATVAALFAICLLAVAAAVSAAQAQAETPPTSVVDAAAPVPTPPTDRTEPTGCSRLWIHPVTAPIVDGYRPPSSPYGPGNRGLEYGTTLGDPVHAVADGVVRFSGQVGGSRFVVLDHPSGLRSTYGYVHRTLVSVGDPVLGGHQLAEAGPGFHLTARLAGRYRDPTPLLDETCYRTRLVPVPEVAKLD